MLNKSLKQVVIVGGGSSGWMAANLMAHRWAKQGISISLIESEKIGTIGVGEGSTPFLKAFFDELGIAEQDWMPACNATYKCGINFPGWSTVTGHESYFHPFYSDSDAKQAKPFFENCQDRRNGTLGPILPDDYFVSGILAKQRQAPICPPEHPTDIIYGYHFDAGLLGQYLKKRAIGLGVTHIEDTIDKVHQDGQGNIAILETCEHGPIRGDFFVDCSGLKGLLIQQTLGEKVLPYKQFLANDSAVAIQTPHDDPTSIPSETVSRALSNGWSWHIPLVNRMGNGYVYSSSHISQAQAEQELRDLLGPAADGKKALHIHWNPGRIENHWKQNCVAVGMSQGFLEPLEAPMLFLTQRTIENFIDLASQGGFNQATAEQFNRQINNAIDGTRDYLQAHYKLNTRSDSQYWIDARENRNMSKPLAELLDGWLSDGNFDEVLAKHLDSLAYLKTSWYCIMAGKGHFNPATQPQAQTNLQRYEQAKSQSTEKAAAYFDHFDYLTQSIPRATD